MSQADRSISAVVSDIVADVQGIVRAEVRLAKAEVQAEVTRARRVVLLMVAGAILALFALAFVELGLVYALAQVWPSWSAAGAVAVANGIIAGVLAMMARRDMARIRMTPERTVATIEENIQWAKARTK